MKQLWIDRREITRRSTRPSSSDRKRAGLLLPVQLASTRSQDSISYALALQGPDRAADASPERTALTQVAPLELVDRWESFLNGGSNESQLVGR